MCLGFLYTLTSSITLSLRITAYIVSKKGKLSSFLFLDGELDMRVNEIEVVSELIDEIRPEYCKRAIFVYHSHVDRGLDALFKVHCSKFSMSQICYYREHDRNPWGLLVSVSSRPLNTQSRCSDRTPGAGRRFITCWIETSVSEVVATCFLVSVETVLDCLVYRDAGIIINKPDMLYHTIFLVRSCGRCLYRFQLLYEVLTVLDDVNSVANQSLSCDDLQTSSVSEQDP